MILMLFSSESAFESMAMDWQSWQRTRWSHGSLYVFLPLVHRLRLVYLLLRFSSVFPLSSLVSHGVILTLML